MLLTRLARPVYESSSEHQGRYTKRLTIPGRRWPIPWHQHRYWAIGLEMRHEPASKQYHDAMKNRKIAILSDTVVQRHTTNATVKQHSCGHRLRKDYATPGCDAHLGFTGLEPAVGLRPALWTADHTSSIACVTFPVFTPVPNYTTWWQRHMGVNNLPRVVICSSARPWIEPATYWSQVRRRTIAPLRHNAVV